MPVHIYLSAGLGGEPRSNPAIVLVSDQVSETMALNRRTAAQTVRALYAVTHRSQLPKERIHIALRICSLPRPSSSSSSALLASLETFRSTSFAPIYLEAKTTRQATAKALSRTGKYHLRSPRPIRIEIG